MDDALLFIHGLMKLALVIGIMVLVATFPSQANASGHVQQATAAPVSEHDQDERPSWGRRMLHDDDRWLEDDDASPTMNLDGAPMAGDLDIHGNFFGDCGSACDSWD